MDSSIPFPQNPSGQAARKRGFLQLRDKNSPDKRWWSPERDITLLLPKLLREVFVDLSSENQSAAAMEVEQRLGITPFELGTAAKIYAKIMECVLRRGEYLQNALTESGFTQHRVQALIGLLLVDKLVNLFVEYYGATLHKGEFDPNHQDLQRLQQLLEQFAKGVSEDNDGSVSESGGGQP